MFNKKEWSRQHYLVHKVKYAEQHKKYYQAHRAELAEYHRQYHRQWAQRIKHEVLDHYSTLRGQKNPDGSEIKTPCCGLCQENDLSKLEIDHIAAGGRRHLKSLKVSGGSNFYRWLKQQGYPEGYQTLCKTCNNRKKHWESE
jgi:hypothetical protein